MKLKKIKIISFLFIIFLSIYIILPSCNRYTLKNINLTYSLPLETSPPSINSPEIIDVKDAFIFFTNKAEKYIYLAGLYFTSNINGSVKRSLKRAIKRGVKVCFLFTDTDFSRSEIKKLHITKYTNVEVRFIDIAKLGKSEWGQLHNKYVIFDGKYAIMGSANFSYPAFNDNIEIDTLIVNKNIIKKMEEIFLTDWSYAKSKKLPLFNNTKEESIDLSKRLQLCESTPYQMDNPEIPNIPDGIKKLLRNAKKSIDLEIYAFTSNETNYPLYYNLLRYAQKRGVKIRILISQSTIDARNEKGEYKYPHIRYAINALKKAGIKNIKKFLIWDAAGTQYSAVHSKLLLVDGKYAMVGSNNWTKSASEENIEMAVITSQTQIVNPLQRKFNNDWSSHYAAEIRE